MQYINYYGKTAEKYGYLKFELKNAGKPIPENDLWIASSALENSMTIVTRDKHLLGVDLVQTIEL
ncbi:MAG: hypothetical protein V1779_02765 [bacterium]